MLGGLVQANLRVIRPEDVGLHDYLLCVDVSLLGRKVAKPES
jgi:hypothetical protein